MLTHINPTNTSTIQPAHVVTSIKQSLVIKDHNIFWPVIENYIWIEPLLRGHLFY